MAGIPPLAGFFTKYFILLNAINHSIYFLSLVILLASTLSSYYYLNFIRYITFEKKNINNLFFFYDSSTKEVLYILSLSCFFLVFFFFFSTFLYKEIFFISLSAKYILQ